VWWCFLGVWNTRVVAGQEAADHTRCEVRHTTTIAEPNETAPVSSLQVASARMKNLAHGPFISSEQPRAASDGIH